MQYDSIYSYTAITDDFSLMTLLVIPDCIFHMFGWGILFKVECVSTRNKILSNPLVIKHGNGKSIKIIFPVHTFMFI
jgi:hypothetical protein